MKINFVPAPCPRPGRLDRLYRPNGFTRLTLLAAILACGLLGGRDGARAAGRPERNAHPVFTLTGTTVTSDGNTAVPRVRLTVMPESTSTVSDADGDFLVSWNGKEGWLSVVAEERGRDGREWCKRVTLREVPGLAPGSMYDLGTIRVTPRAQLSYLQMPVMPARVTRPPKIRVPGPKAGEADTCRVQLSYATDLWGRVTRVGVAGGDKPSDALRDALFTWVRSVPWTVANETMCGSGEPFQALDWMDYAWADSTWVLVPALPFYARPRPPGSDPQDR
jgi:hypothetical protein